MANLTITVDGETLKRARIRAIERGESINSYLAEQLRRYADSSSIQSEIFARLAELADSSPGRSQGPWSRDELHRA